MKVNGGGRTGGGMGRAREDAGTRGTLTARPNNAGRVAAGSEIEARSHYITERIGAQRIERDIYVLCCIPISQMAGGGRNFLSYGRNAA